jgi:hypothetical protein
MTVPGTGCFVAIHNLKQGREADYENWHTHEHMIERVAIPGFLRGLRYRSLTNAPRVCTIYHVQSLATLTSPAYLERLNDPTPWTSQSVPLSTGMQKTFCTVVSTNGHGIGGYLGVAQFAPRPGEDDRLRDWLSGEVLPKFASQTGLCGAHLLIGDEAASQTKTKERELRGAPVTVADWIILVEGYDRSAVQGALVTLSGPEGLQVSGIDNESVNSLYSLDFAIEEREAKAIWKRPTGND